MPSVFVDKMEEVRSALVVRKTGFCHLKFNDVVRATICSGPKLCLAVPKMDRPFNFSSIPTLRRTRPHSSALFRTLRYMEMLSLPATEARLAAIATKSLTTSCSRAATLTAQSSINLQQVLGGDVAGGVASDEGTVSCPSLKRRTANSL